ncbi:MAG: hypothetical protein M1483_05450 [Actinobacteria bacterium]|jgi:hypothetical protein|nr:hypothetical protein [Actinomycetota bacterium]MCL6105059.1 hypothetical protein [Actinomycetota bacterium]
MDKHLRKMSDAELVDSDSATQSTTGQLNKMSDVELVDLIFNPDGHITMSAYFYLARYGSLDVKLALGTSTFTPEPIVTLLTEDANYQVQQVALASFEYR